MRYFARLSVGLNMNNRSECPVFLSKRFRTELLITAVALAALWVASLLIGVWEPDGYFFRSRWLHPTNMFAVLMSCYWVVVLLQLGRIFKLHKRAQSLNWRVCPVCAFDLSRTEFHGPPETDQQTGRCPECGFECNLKDLERIWRST